MPDKPLDLMTPEEIIALMDEADARAARSVSDARPEVARAAVAAASALRSGGRLIYVGAGSSGRLGVLDASECPPTFSSAPGQVVGIIAGGDRALRDAVEGAEDDEAAGRAAMREAGVTGRDMVVGVSASGTTPFVLAALGEARLLGASAWLLTCSREGARHYLGDRGGLILAETGKEVVQGSTRLAAGTATKLVLNRITTAAFIMLGKVHGDLMVDVAPTNNKLRNRATDIVAVLAGLDHGEAAKLLDASGGNPKTAVVMGVKGMDRDSARRLLDGCGGSLRAALGRE